jgi:hypothetical protein
MSKGDDLYNRYQEAERKLVHITDYCRHYTDTEYEAAVEAHHAAKMNWVNCPDD